MELENKSVYAFGDSIIYGHIAPEKSFMQIIAAENNLKLTMYAKNGATVIPQNDNNIISQINNASSVSPDMIIFNGYTNDAYPPVLDKLGSPEGCKIAAFDNNTFSGAFEEIIYTIKKKWPSAKLIYVTVHKSAARDWNIQCTLHKLVIRICRKWSVDVADVFSNTLFDTRNSYQMKEYIIGENGSHPNEKACRKFYMPLVESLMFSTKK